MRTIRQWMLGALLLLPSSGYAMGVPDDCTQLIVGIAPDWNSIHGNLQLFQRAGGGKWEPIASAFPVLFGKTGLAWGSGLAGQNENGLRKTERDGRAPAGVFRMGKIYTYDAQLPAGADYPFHQVTTADAWSDDVNSPDYNRFVTIPDPANPPPWFAKQKMRHNDFAYRWLVEIRHNSDPPVPGAGSAIFPYPPRSESADGGLHHHGRAGLGENDHVDARRAASVLRAFAFTGSRPEVAELASASARVLEGGALITMRVCSYPRFA